MSYHARDNPIRKNDPVPMSIVPRLRNLRENDSQAHISCKWGKGDCGCKATDELRSPQEQSGSDLTGQLVRALG